MSLADEYERQARWRPWRALFDQLPPVAGRTVLDLGCGPGSQAAELAARGARVLGFDADGQLLRAARAKGLAGAEFRAADLRALPDLEPPADGIWCSFAAAYFPDLATVLASWSRLLRPGGWIALTEIDDLFGHGPLGPRSRALLARYAEEALRAGRYDFHMGGKLAGHLERAGFRVERDLAVEDRELAFDGPADEGVVAAWRDRFDRMRGLRAACGPELAAVRDELLDCLTRPDHASTARVCFCLATRPEGPG